MKTLLFALALLASQSADFAAHTFAYPAAEDRPGVVAELGGDDDDDKDDDDDDEDLRVA